MAALTEDRNTHRRDGDYIYMGVAAAKTIYAGALVARDASGYATPGAVATTLLGQGRAEEQVDNSAGIDGALSVQVRKGVFKFGNSAAADLISIAEIGDYCYIVDDQTVAKTDGSGTRSTAGRIFQVDSDGVWVEFNHIEAPVTYNQIRVTKVSITAANLKLIRATPQSLVAAAGASTVVEFVSAILKLEAGSEVLAETADNLVVRYTDGSGAIVSETIETTGFIDQAADTYSNSIPKKDVIVAATGNVNKALVLHNSGDGELTGNASDDAVLEVYITYRIHDVS